MHHESLNEMSAVTRRTASPQWLPAFLVTVPPVTFPLLDAGDATAGAQSRVTAWCERRR